MYQKVIISGRQVEIYEFEKTPLNIGRKSGTRNKGRRVKVKYPALFRTKANTRRVKKSFERLVYSALAERGAPMLITFTMLSIVSLSDAYKQFTKFSERLRRLYGKEIEYICVPEFQERGAVHFHVLYWGLPDTVILHEGGTGKDKGGSRKRIAIWAAGKGYDISQFRNDRIIQNTWGWGFVDCLPTDGNEKLAGYLSKYMSKAMHDFRILRQKAYCRSKGLFTPASFNSRSLGSLSRALDAVGLEHTVGKTEWEYDDKIILSSDVDKLVAYKCEFDTMWLGRASYKVIHL